MDLYIPGILNVLQNIIQLLGVLKLKFYASGFVCEHACVKDVSRPSFLYNSITHPIASSIHDYIITG